jgi:hypothetical protein
MVTRTRSDLTGGLRTGYSAGRKLSRSIGR